MKKSAITGLAILCLSAGAALASQVTYSRPWSPIYRVDGYENASVVKVCDEGRAVYIMTGYRKGALDVVENASECNFDGR